MHQPYCLNVFIKFIFRHWISLHTEKGDGKLSKKILKQESDEAYKKTCIFQSDLDS